MTGYVIQYTDRDGEKTDTTVADSDELSLTIDHCGENVNISIIALPQHLPSEPQIINLTLRKIITAWIIVVAQNIMIVLTLVTFNSVLSWLSIQCNAWYSYKIMLSRSMIVNFNTLHEILISLSLQLSLALSPYIQ